MSAMNKSRLVTGLRQSALIFEKGTSSSLDFVTADCNKSSQPYQFKISEPFLQDDATDSLPIATAQKKHHTILSCF